MRCRGCARCDSGSGLCTECPAGLDLVGGACLRPCPDGSSSAYANATGRCACKPGLFLSADGTRCFDCPANCSLCAAGGRCDLCVDGYRANSAGVCVRLDDANACPTELGYAATPDEATGVCVCEAGLIADPASGKCLPVTAESGETVSCPEGTVPRDGRCACADGSWLTPASTCEPCPANCTSCESDGAWGGACTACSAVTSGRDETGRWLLFDGRCVTQCPAGSVRDAAGRCNCRPGSFAAGDRCERCSEGCLACDRFDRCETCGPGLYGLNGLCVEQGLAGASFSDTEGIACLDQHTFDPVSRACVRCDGLVADGHCLAGATSCPSEDARIVNGTCVCPQDGQYISADGKCESCSEGCLRCDPFGGCDACDTRSGYFAWDGTCARCVPGQAFDARLGRCVAGDCAPNVAVTLDARGTLFTQVEGVKSVAALKFAAGGGSLGGQATAQVALRRGDRVDAITSQVPTWSGHVFIGWWLIGTDSESLEPQAIRIDPAIVVPENCGDLPDVITLIAGWVKAEPDARLVVFDAFPGTMCPPYAFGAADTNWENAFAHCGYSDHPLGTFTGWSLVPWQQASPDDELLWKGTPLEPAGPSWPAFVSARWDFGKASDIEANFGVCTAFARYMLDAGEGTFFGGGSTRTVRLPRERGLIGSLSAAWAAQPVRDGFTLVGWEQELAVQGSTWHLPVGPDVNVPGKCNERAPLAATGLTAVWAPTPPAGEVTRVVYLDVGPGSACPPVVLTAGQATYGAALGCTPTAASGDDFEGWAINGTLPVTAASPIAATTDDSVWFEVAPDVFLQLVKADWRCASRAGKNCGSGGCGGFWAPGLDQELCLPCEGTCTSCSFEGDIDWCGACDPTSDATHLVELDLRGESSSPRGSTCLACPTGRRLVGSTCEACPTGQALSYGAGWIPTCVATCPADYVRHDGPNGRVCLQTCPSGFMVQSGVCVACAAGCDICVGTGPSQCVGCAYGYGADDYEISASGWRRRSSFNEPFQCKPCEVTTGVDGCTNCQANLFDRNWNQLGDASGTQKATERWTCGSCDSGRYHDTSFSDLNQNQCEACDPSCATCVSGLASTCQSCPSGTHLHPDAAQTDYASCVTTCPADSVPYADKPGGPSYCQCPFGTWWDGSSCSSCHPSCAASGEGCYDRNACCWGDTWWDADAGACVSDCGDGKFPDYSGQTRSCITCQGAECCQQGQYWDPSTNTCVNNCPTGSWGDYGQRTCSPCPAGCTRCSDSVRCDACESGHTLVEVFEVYQNWYGTCSPCPDKREYRDGSGTCVGCPANTFLYRGHKDAPSCVATCPGHTFGDPASGLCVSVKGCSPRSYPDVFADRCVACDVNCRSCVGPAPGQCSSCDDADTLTRADGIGPYGACIGCSIGGWESAGGCASCDTGKALTWDTTQNPWTHQCVSQCPAGTYRDVLRKACVVAGDCPSLTLADDVTRECRACPTGQVFWNDTCLAACPDGMLKQTEPEGATCTYGCNGGYTQVGHECVQCAPGCSSCSGPGPEQCTWCKAGYTPDYVHVSSTGWRWDSNRFACVSCSTPENPFCSWCGIYTRLWNGSWPGGSVGLETFVHKGVDCYGCDNGTFASPSEARPGERMCGAACDPSCALCDGPGPGRCVACRSGEVLLPAGYGNTFGQCAASCPAGAVEGARLTPDNMQIQRFCDCPSRFRWNGSTCDACHPSWPAWWSCDKDPACGSSEPGAWDPDTSRCVSDCGAGRYRNDITRTCTPCPGGTCCPSGQIWDAGSGTCAGCPSGTYFDWQTRTCAACVAGCGSCGSRTSCWWCPSGATAGAFSFLMGGQTTVCGNCPSSNEYRDGNGACVQCAAGTYLAHDAEGGPARCVATCPFGTFALASTRECVTYNSCVNAQRGYVPPGTSVCSPCHGSCSSCDGPEADDCLGCMSGSIVRTPDSAPSGACPTTCRSGSYPNGGQCEQCLPGTFLLWDNSGGTWSPTCVAQCPAGRFGDASARACVGDAECPDGTYADTSQRICAQCSTGCSRCVGPGSSDCTSCRWGYAWVNHEIRRSGDTWSFAGITWNGVGACESCAQRTGQAACMGCMETCVKADGGLCDEGTMWSSNPLPAATIGWGCNACPGNSTVTGLWRGNTLRTCE